MNPKRNVTALDTVKYGVVMMLANLGGTIAALGVLSLLRTVTRNRLLVLVLFFAVLIAGTPILTWLYFWYKIPDIVPKCGDGVSSRRMIFDTFLRVVLPAEIMRWILVSLPTEPGHILEFGYRFFEGVFAFLPNFLYDIVYMSPRNRLSAIRESGYIAADHLAFHAVYFVYFLITLAVLYLLFERVWRGYEGECKKKNLTADISGADGMTQNEQIIKRDFYYQRDVTAVDRCKFAAVSLGAQLAAYYYILCFTSLLSMWQGSATHAVLQALCTLPVAALLPSFLVHRYLTSVVPKLYSLRDEEKWWYKKAVRLMLGGEIFRFLVGLIPLPFTAYGVLTSPVTYLLYTIAYVNPAGKYEAIFVHHSLSPVDTAVFLIIYVLYFSLYNFFLYRRCRHEVRRQHVYLTGCLQEKEKSDSYYYKG